MRLVLAALLTAVALPALAFDPAQMTDAERKAFRAEVQSYLMENPEVIMEAVALLEAQKVAEEAAADRALVEAYKTALFDDPSAWVGGNPEGDITLIEFVDYRCGYCRKANAEVEELIKSDGNIRFIVKDYPILGPESELAARFAIAIRQLEGDQAYKAAHDALITMRGDVTADTLGRLAASLQLDPARVLAQMNTPEVMAVIEANHALGREMQVNGTPTFVIGGQMVRGYLPLGDMREVVSAEREQG
jgi:protein-disulfide isomerase